MSRETWNAVDRFFEAALHPADDALTKAEVASRAADLPTIQVAPNQGRFLQLLALSIGAKRILEIGTLGGYSTIWLARALSGDGRVVSLEADARHAAVARANIAAAGLADRVDIRVGAALETLPRLEKEGGGPFDLSFIDADKANIPAYYQWAVKLSRPGSLIIVDNVVRNGEVVDAASKDPDVQGVRRFVKMVGADPRVRAVALQTVGVKGHDGLAIVRVESAAS